MTDETSSASPEGEAAAPEKKIQFSTQRVYVKDVSFEAPNGLPTSTSGWNPKVNQDLNTQISRVGDDLYEVVLKVTLKVDFEDEKTAFLVEVHQAGLFGAAGMEAGQLQHLLSSQCPHIIFPYAREAIDSLVVRGGFPPLMLPPINFEALYAQAVVQSRKQAEAGSESVN